MTTNSRLLERRSAAVARGVGTMHPIFAARAANAELWDVEGRRYVDFAGGIAVLNTGHCHPGVIAAAEAQMRAYTHPCFQVTAYEPYVALAERLNALAPGKEPKKSIFLTTGAEAVENAVKIARGYTGRSAVIAFDGSFHGRTTMTMALTGKVQPYKAGFGPLSADVYHVPFPNEIHGVTPADSIAAIERLFKVDVEASRVAAIIIEPVQGEGGFYVAPPEFLRALRALCDRHGIVLIADEVQSGAGRTGRMFAIEHSGVVPDLITMAKSLAGGFPLSAVVGRADIVDSIPPGGLGGTYGGNPVACAAALAVLDAFEKEKLLERATAIGERIQASLTALAKKVDRIGEVRGLGAMVAMELFKDPSNETPDPELTRALVAGALERGLVLLSCGAYGNVIRILVPLTASDAVVDEGLAIIADAMLALAGKTARAREGAVAA
jgi:4-aminobutyrate aminotransferase/(S)-3-amino-2-methylpropionate transaminase